MIASGDWYLYGNKRKWPCGTIEMAGCSAIPWRWRLWGSKAALLHNTIRPNHRNNYTPGDSGSIVVCIYMKPKKLGIFHGRVTVSYEILDSPERLKKEFVILGIVSPAFPLFEFLTSIIRRQNLRKVLLSSLLGYKYSRQKGGKKYE